MVNKPVEFPVSDFRKALYPGTKVFDLGCGTPSCHNNGWGKTIVKNYPGVQYFGIDNGGLCLADMFMERVRDFVRKRILKSRLTYHHGSYLMDLPSDWGKADVIVMNSPNPTHDFIRALEYGMIASLIRHNLKFGGAAFILTEWFIYNEYGSLPDISRGPVVKWLFDKTLRRTFGPDNVFETQIPEGYYPERCMSYSIVKVQRGFFPEVGLSFYQVRNG